MSLETLIWECELHRETYVALLSGALVSRGAKARLAERVGITPQYLSYILVTDRDPDALRAVKRTPSAELAGRIAEALPLAPEQRDILLEHMLHARRQSEEAVETMRSTLARPDVTVDALLALDEAAYSTEDRQTYRLRCEALRGFVLALLGQLRAREYPQIYAQAMFSLCGIEAQNGRLGQALYYAKATRFVLEHLAPPQRDRQRDILLHCAILAESNYYVGLGLHDEGYRCCLEAEELALVGPTATERISLYLHALRARRGMPRAPLRDIESLAVEAERICDHPEDNAFLFTSFVQRELARTYIQREQYAKAERILYHRLHTLGEIHLNPLHRVQLLAAQAALCWHRGDRGGWEHHVRAAVAIANEAGLSDQLAKLRAAYGPAVKPLLGENSPPA